MNKDDKKKRKISRFINKIKEHKHIIDKRDYEYGIPEPLSQDLIDNHVPILLMNAKGIKNALLGDSYDSLGLSLSLITMFIQSAFMMMDMGLDIDEATDKILEVYRLHAEFGDSKETDEAAQEFNEWLAALMGEYSDTDGGVEDNRRILH